MRRNAKRLALVLLILPLFLGLLAGCGSRGSANEMTVLAGSEVQDMEPFLDEIQNATGVRLKMQ